MKIEILLILVLIGHGQAMIGYDCGVPSAEISTISLLEVGKCELPKDEVKTNENFIQLLQLVDYPNTKVFQCRIKIYREVNHCGWSSYTSVIDGGKLQFLEDVSREQCLEMHKTLKLQTRGEIMTLKANGTVTESMTFAGEIDSGRNCKTGKYRDPYGKWENVVVTGYIEISLYDYYASVKLDSNEIYLKTKTTCELTKLNCKDSEGSDTFWDYIPHQDCDFIKYGVLYNGIVNKTNNGNDEYDDVIYSLESKQVTFAVRAKGYDHVCGYKIIRTEHPKLFVIETSPTQLIVNREVSTVNLDPFAYVNSKFVYLERSLQINMKTLYMDMFTHKCNLERDTIKNLLVLSTLSPDEFAYELMKGPGYMAVVVGEVVHVMKCIPTEVEIEIRQECFEQLAVLRNNESYFITPRTHILINKGVQIPCNVRTSPYYLIHNKWYQIDPLLHKVEDPIQLKPSTNITWNYTAPAFLATSGIYPLGKLNELRNHVLFKMNEKGVMNTFVRGAIGESVVNQGESLANLIDERSINKIIKSTWEKTWGKFTTFGTASAGFITILILMKMIKFLIDTFIHGYALHEAYGCSIAIFGAIWDSLTGVLLWLAGKRHSEQKFKKFENDIELGMKPVIQQPEQKGNGAQASAPELKIINESPIDKIEIQQTSETNIPTTSTAIPNSIYPTIYLPAEFQIPGIKRQSVIVQ